MGSESKSFPLLSGSDVHRVPISRKDADRAEGNRRLWLEILVGYGFILMAIWTPDGPLKFAWMMLAVISIASFAFVDSYSSAEMGLGVPPGRGSATILLFGLLMAAMLPVAALLSGQNLAPAPVRWHTAWQYVIWAVMQQFILQSFMYVRLEWLVGSRKAVIAAASLFALAHIPSPVLTVCTFVGGLFFCEMFRRYRNIFALGIAHAVLGLTVAASFSDHLLHHMRVGIGYLMFHPHHLP